MELYLIYFYCHYWSLTFIVKIIINIHVETRIIVCPRIIYFDICR